MCKIKLSEDKASSNEAYPFGEQAHIVAEEEGGPRGKSPLTAAQRNSYPNLILLCPTHHTKIDKAPDEYPVELLHQIKAEHELWFEKARVTAADKAKQANDYIYAQLVDSAAKLCMFEEWESWTSWPLSTHPCWKRAWIESVGEFRRLTLRANWPGANLELERALNALALNLSLAVKVFSQHCHQDEDEWVREIRFYKRGEDTDRYGSLLEQYERWIDEQNELVTDATKCANWVAEVVRRDINPMFFAFPGKFVITYGPDINMRYVTRVAEYSVEDKLAEPARIEGKWKNALEADRQRQRELMGE